MTTIYRRFENWNEARREANLDPKKGRGVTDEEILEDFKRVVDKLDTPPSRRDYDEHGEYSVSTIRNHFGSVPNLLTQMGITPKGSVTEEQLIEDLQRVAEIVDSAPTFAEYEEHGKYSSTPIYNIFGSYTNAIREAGYTPVSDQTITRKELQEDILRVAEIVGKTPTKEEYQKHGEYSPTTVVYHYGSWNSFISEIGLTPPRNIPEEDLIKDIQRVGDVVDGAPTSEEYSSHGRFSTSPLYDRFGSWGNTLREAGYFPNEKPSDRELLTALRETASDSVVLSPAELREELRYSLGTYARAFDDWWTAIVLAGLIPRDRRPLRPYSIHQFHEAAKDLQPPDAVIMLLAQFTSLSVSLMPDFSHDWIADRTDKFIVKVPKKITGTRKTWMFRLPETWKDPYLSERRRTHLTELLDWYWDHYDTAHPESGDFVRDCLKRTGKEANLGGHRETLSDPNMGDIPRVTGGDLRITRAINLARQGTSSEIIRTQLGSEYVNTYITPQQAFTWLYVHEGYEHPDYDPPNAVFDPVDPS